MRVATGMQLDRGDPQILGGVDGSLGRIDEQ